MLALALEWSRCPDGVEIDDRGEPAMEPNRSLLARFSAEAKAGQWYKAKSERRVAVSYDAVNLENPIVLHFINTQTDDERRGFFDRFGMGTGDSEQSVDDVSTWHGYLGASTTLALSGVTEARASAVNNLTSRVRLKPGFDFSGEGGKPRVTLRPETLNQFMCMEVAIAAENDVSIRLCENCRKQFFTGPLTGRRSTARFCSDRCRVAAMRKRGSASGRDQV